MRDAAADSVRDLKAPCFARFLGRLSTHVCRDTFSRNSGAHASHDLPYSRASTSFSHSAAALTAADSLSVSSGRGAGAAGSYSGSDPLEGLS